MGFMKKSLFLFLFISFTTNCYGENLQLFEQIVKKNPDSSEAHLKLGRAYQKNNKPSKAINSFKRSILLDQGNETAHIFLGELYYNQGTFDLASIHYKKALTINRCASYYNHYANALTKNDQMKPAIVSYKKAVLLDPKNPLFYYGLGYVYRKTGRYREYKKLSLKLNKIDKDFGRKLKNDSELFSKVSRLGAKSVKKKNTN